MSDDKPLIQDNDPSTEGGPKKGLAFMIIVGVLLAAAVGGGLVAVYLL